MRLWRLVAACAVLLGATGLPEDGGRRVLDLHPLKERLHTDGSGDLGFSAAADASRGRVKRMWGVSDGTATVGTLFVHDIDKNAFHGPVQSFQVGGRTLDAPLPSWLTFDAGRRRFSGVPLYTDVGPQLVTVRALAEHDTGGAKDRFMVDVVHEPDLAGRRIDADGHGEVACSEGSATTVASVYFDVAPKSLDGTARLQMLYAVADAARVPPDVVHMTSHLGAVPVGDRHVLEAGPGAAERTSPQLAVLSWKVGCSEQVWEDLRAGLEGVQRDRRLSSLSATAGHTAVAWLLFSREPAGRHRRQVGDDGSGDYYDYDDDSGWVDYDGTYDEWGNEDYNEVEPVGHVVPPLASPTPGAPLASPVYPPPRVTASPDRSRMTTVIPVPVAPTRYFPDAGLQPSHGWDDRPAPGSRHPTTDLESSMRHPARPEATARWPEGLVTATPTVPGPRLLDTAAVGSSNFPPHLRRRIRKLLVIAGEQLRLRVPEGTFQDLESGGTRQLYLMLTKDTGHKLLKDDWIQFDTANQEIYGLPKEEDIGEYKFRLTAQDSEGANVTDIIDVVVRQYQQWRAINHKFHLQFKLLKPRQYPVKVDWELLLMRKLAAMQGDEGTGSLLVYDMHDVQEQQVRLVWVNRSLSTHSCDTPELSRIAARLLGKEGVPSVELRKVLSPEFSAVSVGLELSNVCQGEKLTAVPQQSVTARPETNQPPVRRKPIDLISARVGRLLKLQVPEETFFDVQDGDVRRMELNLLTNERQPVSTDSWLRFEPRNQEFIGLPLDGDVGSRHYHLECIDSGGLKVADSIEVVVEGRDQDAPDHTVQFSVTLDNDFSQFDRDPLQKARLMQKLAGLFGDASTDAMLVHDIREGSVVFSWYNESLPTDSCPDAEIDVLRQRLMDEWQKVTAAAVQALAPDFRLTSAEVTPRGICLADGTPTVPPQGRPEDVPAPDESAPEGKGDEYLVTFIIPAVVIAAMLLIAGVIACVLFRARRRGKMQMTDNGTYVSRGIPVIFSDELEDRMEKNAKTPVMLTNEQPPEPPTYPASVDGASSPATPMLNARGEPAGEDAPYERPPPFAGADEGRASRATKPVPNYRQPPPYVPP